MAMRIDMKTCVLVARHTKGELKVYLWRPPMNKTFHIRCQIRFNLDEQMHSELDHSESNLLFHVAPVLGRQLNGPGSLCPPALLLMCPS